MSSLVLFIATVDLFILLNSQSSFQTSRPYLCRVTVQSEDRNCEVLHLESSGHHSSPPQVVERKGEITTIWRSRQDISLGRLSEFVYNFTVVYCLHCCMYRPTSLVGIVFL